MRRRHLLALSAGALAAPALITQPARAAVETRELHGYRIRAYGVRLGLGLARRRLQRRRHGVVRPASVTARSTCSIRATAA